MRVLLDSSPSMRLLVLFALGLGAHAQILSMTWSGQYNYSNQLNGSNGWANNGRFADQDTTRATLCPDDGKTYLSGNDGYGPNSIISASAAVFLTTMGDFTTPAAGVLQTLVNPMTSLGLAAQDIYSNGNSMKSEGLLCRGGRLYWSVYQQFSANDTTHGYHSNLMTSLDHGGTWCNPAHTDSSGTCTVTPSATGDVPGVNDAPLGDVIKFLHFLQYDSGAYQYCYGVSELAAHVYACRVLVTDLPKTHDGSHIFWYKGTDPVHDWMLDASWDLIANVVSIEPSGYSGNISDVSDALYLPAFHTYVMLFGPRDDSTLPPSYYQSQTPVGPWTLLYAKDFYAVLNESWDTPILSSLSVSGNVARINFLTTMGPPEQELGSPTNRYNPIFHVATFMGVVAPFAVPLFTFTQGAGQMQIKPQAMPTALTTVATADAFLKGVTITNPTANAITALVEDGQGVPVPFLGTIAIAAHSTEVLPYGYWCPGGFSVQAGGAGLDYYATWKQ